VRDRGQLLAKTVEDTDTVEELPALWDLPPLCPPRLPRSLELLYVPAFSKVRGLVHLQCKGTIGWYF
jgi:hypothetical protein